MELLLLLAASAATDLPADGECGYCGGWWTDRLRLPVLGWRWTWPQWLTGGGECGHCFGWWSVRLRYCPRGCGSSGRILLWLMARDGGGRDGDYISSLSNL